MDKRKRGESRLEDDLPYVDRMPSFHAYELSQTVAVLTQSVEAQEKQLSNLAKTTDSQIREVMNVVRELGVQTTAKIDALGQAFSASRITNWPLVISAIGAVALFVGAAYRISDLQTQVTMSPLASAAEVSKKDRDELHQEIALNRNEISDIKAGQKVTTAKLKEVETQFKAADQSRNVQFAEQQRMNNIIFQIAQGAGGKDQPIVYPTGPFYHPDISQDGSSSPPQ